MDSKPKVPVLETEMLWNPRTGTVLRTTYYSDGSFEEQEIPKYPPIIPIQLVF